MLNLIQHPNLIKKHETLKQVQGDNIMFYSKKSLK